jgi:hypothetical protein
MKNNRLDVILHRNQQSAFVDLLLAVVFLVAAMTTGLAMKTAFGHLTGAPAISSADPASIPGHLVPCAPLAARSDDGGLIAFADSHAAGTPLLR